MSDYLDTTKTGNASYKELQKANDISSQEVIDEELLKKINSLTPKRARDINTFVSNFTYNTPKHIPGYDSFGESKYDPEVIFEHELDNLEHIRATNQSSLDKVANALVKTGVIAGTTFLQGTVGLAAGVADALGNIGNKNESGWETFSRLFHNDVSNTLSEVNDWSEREFANYKTNEEQNNSWLENLGTVNFWFDDVFKNVVGFAGGAMLAGGGITTLARNLGAVSTKLGARVVGTLAGAAGESSIVANDALKEFRATETEKLATEYNNIKNNILSSGLSSEQKAYALNDLDQNMEKRHQEMLETTARNAIFTGAVSMAATSLNDFFSISRIYAANMRVPKAKTGDSFFKRADKYASQQEKESFAKRIFKKEDGSYDYKKLTKKEQLLRGLGKASLEGWEEMAQQFGTSTGAALSSYDSPDSYYEALLDDEAIINTKDLLTSVIEGFGKSYGDFGQWEQFFVGAVGGLIGLPTFGKVQNSDSSTWLGKDKKVGISGGLFGYMKEYSNENKDLENTVNEMNSHLDKVKKQTMHFAQSNAFTNIKEGFSEEDNTFERKNAEDNEDFAIISSYVKAGRLQDYKDLVNQDFENISDDQLGIIARGSSSTGSDINGWKNVDGTYKSDSEEGRKEMRKALSEKRDKILKEIDNYEKSVQTVLNATGGILSEDETNELAWLQWKAGRFLERYKDIHTKYSHDLNKFSNLLLDIRDKYPALKDAIGEKNLETLSSFVSALGNSNNAFEVSSLIKENPEIMEVLQEGTLETLLATKFFNEDVYSNFKEDIKDLPKLAILAEQFDAKYQEYISNPYRVREHRQEMQDKREAQNAIAESTQRVVDISNMSSQEVRQGLQEGSITEEDIKNMSDPTQSIIDGKELSDIEDMIKRTPTSEQVDRSIYDAVIEEVLSSVDSIEDLNNIDIDSIDLDIIPSNETSPEAILQDKSSKLANVFPYVKDVIEDAISKKKEGKAMPTQAPDTEEIEEDKGKDPTSSVEAINEEESKSKQESVRERARRINTISDIVQGYKGPIQRMAILRSQVSAVLDHINQNHSLGSSYEDTMKGIEKSLKQIYNTYPEAVTRLNNYAKDLFSNNKKEEGNQAQNTTESSIEEDINTNYEPAQEVSTDTLDSSTNKIEVELQNENNSKKNYSWRTATTEIGIHNSKGDNTPFYIIAKDLAEKGSKSIYFSDYIPYLRYRYNKENDTFNYSEEELRRMEEVHKYLSEKGAFNRANSGELSKGEVVHFIVDSALNEKAGDLVILITNSKGEIIGDLVDKNGAKSNSELLSFIEKIESEYNSTEDKTNFMSKYSSSIKELLYGKVPFTVVYDTHTLKEVFGNNKVQLAYADRLGNIQGFNKKLKIRKPQSVTKGSAYVLFPSGTGTYLPLPFILKEFNEDTLNTKAGQLVNKTLKNILEGKGILKDHIKTLSTLLNAGFSFKKVEGRWDIVMVKNKEVIPLYRDLTPIRTFTLEDTVEGNTASTKDILDEIIRNISGTVTFKLQSDAIGTVYNIDGERVAYEDLISEVGIINLPKDTTSPVNTWFTVEPSIQETTSSSDVNTSNAASITEESVMPELSKSDKALWDKIEEDTQQKIMSLDKVQEFLDKLKAEGLTGRKSREAINSIAKSIIENDESFSDITRYMEIENADSISSTQEGVNYSSLTKELQWLEQALPELSSKERLILQDNLIKIKGDRAAYGMFKNGIITISRQGIKGTVYHEAFHAVFHMLMDYNERAQLFKEGYKIFGENNSAIYIEEQLAEAFRKFMQNREDTSIKGRLTRWFRKLRHRIRTLFNSASYLDTVFYKIEQGNFNNRKIKDNTSAVRYIENDIDIDYRELELVDTIKELEDNVKDITSYYKNKAEEYNNLFSSKEKSAKKENIFYTFKHDRLPDGTYKKRNIKIILFNEVASYSPEYVLNSIPEKYRPLVEVTEYKGKQRAIMSVETKIKALQNLAKERDNVLDYYKEELNRYKKELSEYTENKKQKIATTSYNPIRVKNYHKSLYDYDNLNKEQVATLSNLNMPIEEYNQMSLLEKEIFWDCNL